VGDAHFGVDNIVTLDVGAFAGELSVPGGLGVILAAGLLLAITKNLSVAVFAVAIAVALALSKRLPLNVVVRNVGVINGLLAVRFGSGDGDEGEENNSDLNHLDNIELGIDSINIIV